MGTRLKALTQNFKMVHAILQILHVVLTENDIPGAT